ncbi:LTA synthase family protein [Planococcus sp. FY231025]|uniref:LTA synthase family protein n=1 Tax=Planococcus sp. FY231025 TaxID=3455699 RepID=UPI003F905761
MFRFRGVLAILAALVYFYFLIGGIETFLNNDPEQTAAWKEEKPNAFFFNVMITFSIFLLFLGLFNRFLISFILTNGVAWFLAAMSYFKFSFLGEYLYPWDLMLYDNVVNLLPNLIKEVDFGKVLLYFFGAIALVAALAAFIRIKKPKRLIRLNIWKRLVLIVVAAGFLSLFIFYRSIPNVETSLKDAGVTNITFDQNRNYKTNGFFVTFLLNMQSAIVLPPSGYNEKNINEIIENLESRPIPAGSSPTEKPNVIVIMSESFWDPTAIPSLEFAEDPMPTVRKHQNGNILTSTFGGGTSNVEFEALTGFTNMFLPPGSVPYQQYIKHELPALPRYLDGLGYQTTAVHPYPKWFWNREEVYRHIGFEEFIDIDGFDDPLYKGPFVSDEQVTRTLIEQVEETEEPLFAYAITMQNHTSYNSNKYPEFTVETTTPPEVDPVFNLLLRSFTQGIADADAAFKALTGHFEASEEPTLIVFFGDHLPALGHDYKLFKQAGFVPKGPGEENWELEDFKNMHTTPLAIWSNYGADIPELGTISPSFLAPAIFDLAGIEKPLYYSLLENFQKEMPGYTSKVKIDAEGELYKVTPDSVEDVKRAYELIQYDLLFGKQYAKEKLFGQ